MYGRHTPMSPEEDAGWKKWKIYPLDEEMEHMTAEKNYSKIFGSINPGVEVPDSRKSMSY